MTFKDLELIEPILKALDKKGYTSPTPIQQQAIMPALKGRDVLGLAQTGTGKTAAFTLPIIQSIHLNNPNKKGVQALILTPTRELAIQINDSLEDYTKYTTIKHSVIFGGVKQTSQVKQLKEGVEILVATPGRLLDLMNQGIIKLNTIRYFVLDEADRMLDMGFIHDIKKILPKLPKDKQTLFFSATMPNAIAKLSHSILQKPVRVEVSPVSSTVDTVEQYVYFAEKAEKKDLLINLLNEESAESVLVFSRTKHGADRIARILSKANIVSQAIHGNKSQNARQRALLSFKSKETRVLIATDIAARGIDIDSLELVINYDLSDTAETYVHRIGRTGRAGKSGRAISFCASDERAMLKEIQKLIGKTLPILETEIKINKSTINGEIKLIQQKRNREEQTAETKRKTTKKRGAKKQSN